MDKQTFKDLTGEDPEDMFGGDWENEIKELEINPEEFKFCEDDYCKEILVDGFKHYTKNPKCMYFKK